MRSPGWRAPICLSLIAAAGAAPSVATAKACAAPLSAAILQTARRSRLEIVFNPSLVAGRCADGFVGSGDPERDLSRLARLAGLEVDLIKPGLAALTRAEPSAVASPSPRDPSGPPRPPAAAPSPDVVVTARPEQGGLIEKRFATARMSVISSEQISARPASNIVDAVSVLPGVSIYADMGLGQAATGNPEFITIQGIDSSNDVYELNGVRVPQSDPDSRALSLKMIPPFGVQSVSVVKTPTAEADGDSIGGVVDIETPTGFDFARPLSRLTVQGDLDSLAAGAGQGGLGGAAQYEYARRFDGDHLAVYLTGYAERTNSVGESGEVGGWVPTLASQAGLTNLRLATGGLSADEYKWDVYTNTIRDYGGVLSIDYRNDGQRLYARLTASTYDDQGVDSQFSLRQQLANTGKNAAGQVVDVYGDPVGPGLPGVAAYAPQQVSLNPGGGAYDAAGRYDPNGVLAGAYFQLRDQTDALYALKLGGSSDIDRLTLSYEVSYGYSRQARPNYVEGSSYGLPLESARLNIGWLNPYTPSFALTAAEQAYLFNPANIALWKLQGFDAASTDGQWGGKLDLDDRQDRAVLRAVHAGLAYSEADRGEYQHNFTGDNDGNFALLSPQGYAPPFYAPAGPSLLDQPGRLVSGSFLNLPIVLKALNRGDYVDDILPYRYRALYAVDPATGLATIGDPGPYTINDYNIGAASSVERIAAAYGLADLQLGGVEAHPGLRVETTALDADYWDPAQTAFQNVRKSYAIVLPSLNLVYRRDDGWVFRAAVRRGFSRPAIGLLAGPVTVGVDGGGAISEVSENNPDLKPMTSINYDASAEYYGVHGALFEISIYRKQLSNVIYAAQVTDAPPQAELSATVVDGVTYTRPINGGSGHLNGLELNLQDRFVDLPAPFGGLGLSANATIQQSAASSGLANHFGRSTWLPRAPELIYNLDLSYKAAGWLVSLGYQYTGLQLENLTGDNLDNYLQPTRFLNLEIGRTAGGFRWSFGAKNLTDGPVFWKTLGPSTRYLGAQDAGGNGSYVITGRVFSFTASKTW
jgi:TonB-dependent receptor